MPPSSTVPVSASAATVWTPATSRSQPVTLRTQCLHRMERIDSLTSNNALTFVVRRSPDLRTLIGHAVRSLSTCVAPGTAGLTLGSCDTARRTACMRQADADTDTLRRGARERRGP